MCHDVEMHRSLSADSTQRPCRYRSFRFHRRWLSLRLYDPRIRQVLRRQNRRGIPATAPPMDGRAGGRVKLRRKRKLVGVVATPRSAHWQRAGGPRQVVDRATGWTPDTIHPRSHGEVAMGRLLHGNLRSCDKRALDRAGQLRDTWNSRARSLQRGSYEMDVTVFEHDHVFGCVWKL